MERVLSIVKQIWDFEGFCVEFERIDDEIELKPYNVDDYGNARWQNRFTGKKSINKWIERRFDRYGNSKIRVLNGDGDPVNKRTLVGNLRKTYDSYELIEDDDIYDDEDE